MQNSLNEQHTQTEIIVVGLLLAFSTVLLWKLWYLFKRWNNRTLLHRVGNIKHLKKLSWEEFETLCKELFQKQGWNVSGNDKKGADGGVDLWMRRRMKRAIVQCKHYDDALVTIKVIREMYGLQHEYNVDEVYVVTSSRFTKECYLFAENKSMTLIDGEILVKMIDKVTR